MPRRDSAEPAGKSKSRLEVPFMPDRRRVAAKAIIAAGAYLHPNLYVGDPDKKLWQIQSDAPITDMDANFLESCTKRISAPRNRNLRAESLSALIGRDARQAGFVGPQVAHQWLTGAPSGIR